MSDEIRYDDAKIRQQINYFGLTVPGTSASATDLLRIPLVAKLRVNRIRVRATTGGTADGPSLIIGKSLAGTGAVTETRSLTFGTNPDGDVIGENFDPIDFAADDEIVIQAAAGTADSSPVINLAVGYRDHSF